MAYSKGCWLCANSGVCFAAFHWVDDWAACNDHAGCVCVRESWLKRDGENHGFEKGISMHHLTKILYFGVFWAANWGALSQQCWHREIWVFLHGMARVGLAKTQRQLTNTKRFNRVKNWNENGIIAKNLNYASKSIVSKTLVRSKEEVKKSSFFRW